MHAGRPSDILVAMLISFVIPTRNRSGELAFTLEKFQALSLDDLGGVSEVVIVDNGSDVVMDTPGALDNGIRIRRVDLDENIGTSARNIGAQHARGQWIVMLDDYSNLCPGSIGEYLSRVDLGVGAIGGEIFLPSGKHEAGGLPEVFVGCGCAIRRDAFLAAGGYYGGFGYYAEEYDLCAKLIAGGYSIHHTRAFQFEHRKTSTGRDMDEILYRLVRNNGWVIQRHAPEQHRTKALDEMLSRYKKIAINEHALAGYQRGEGDLERTISNQSRSALTSHQWDRFVGNDAMQRSLVVELEKRLSATVTIVGPSNGKGLGQIRSAINACGFEVSESRTSREAMQVIGTLSPGPMLDAKIAFPDAVCPWFIEDSSPIGVHL